jgi:molybdenum cofactor cytidylyltransferase
VAGPHATALAEALGIKAAPGSEPGAGSGERSEPTPRIIVNPRYPEGMLTSVQCGIAAAAAETDWFLIALVDQPMIEPAIVTRLIEVARDPGPRIVIPTFEGRRGHPMLLHASLAAEVQTLSAGIGLRELMQRHPEAVFHVPVDSDSVLRDIDTPEEYERELTRLAEEASEPH